MQFQIPNKVDINIELDSSKTDSFEDLQKLLDQKQQLQFEIATLFVNELKINAEQKLHSTLDDYINSISIEDNQVVLDTSKFTTNMVENGIEAFDMKKGFLASSKVKTSKNGQKYLVVPLSKFKAVRYNWRNRETGQFSKGSNPGGDVEFRIVSENSPDSSWQHPGHPGFHFIDQTLNNIDEKIESFLDDKINSIIDKF